MFDEFLLTINTWMGASFALAVLGSFLWGLVSVLFSPCHLVSIPLVVGYVAGQKAVVEGRQALGYSVLFSAGIFVSIALLGLVCTMLGRMLGDISPYWAIPVGLIFVWLGLNLMGVQACALPSGHMGNIQHQGYWGALFLGFSYGILSGACTFGFIAPILAIMTVQNELTRGLALISAFALGHCLPIVLAGSSAALAQRLLAARGMQKATYWGRKFAGFLVFAIGAHFIISPFYELPF